MAPIYNTFFRRNWQMLGLVFGSAFVFEMYVPNKLLDVASPVMKYTNFDHEILIRENSAYDNGMNKVWDNLNRGRQWKDIRHKYIEAAEEED